VPKCLHKIPKFIKNSAKVHQNPFIKTDENFMFCFVDDGSKMVRSKKNKIKSDKKWLADLICL
jgi:hypothetical protein